MSAHPDAAELEADQPTPEVDAHLRTCPRCRIDRRVLHGTEAPAPAPTAVALPDAAALVATWRSTRSGSIHRAQYPLEDPPRPPPKTLGPYAIDAVLGRGGMAVVYRVVDRRTQEHRALKVLRTDDREVRQRLRREGGVQATLDDPHIVRVLEVMEFEDAPALVLEYVPGPSLHALLHDTDLPLEVVDRLGAEILRGMATAHRAGVVHRDLKPGNVLLAPHPTGWTARITDFGLARRESPTDSLRTRTGTFAGTPMYMAPEQLRDASKADARSDVFSLGALLYELVTGLRCFAGMDHVDIVRRVTDVRYVPVGMARLGVPDRMATAIAAALQADPEARPADADALLDLWSPRAPAVWPPALADTVGVLHRPEEVSDPPAPLPPTNLGIVAEPFVGRSGLRRELAGLLTEERLLTLTGPAGVGKTRLARRVARDEAHRWAGGVWFCDLAAARSVDDVARTVAVALGVAARRDAVQTIGHALAGRGDVLVVLDAFDAVVEHAEAILESWLELAPAARFLVTSREPLDLFDEAVRSIDGLDADDAAALFIRRAGHVPADVEPVLAGLGGLPLAIELAAAGGHTATAEGSAGAPHQLLWSTLQSTWDRCSPGERAALVRLTVFEAPAPLRGALAVLGDWADALPRLVERHLVRERAGRYSLLVPVRAWAQSKGTETERLAAQEAHHGWVSTVAEGEIDPALPDLVAATERAIAADQAARAVAVGRRAWKALFTQGPISQAVGLMSTLLDMEGLTDPERATCLHLRGRAHLADTDPASCVRDARAAMAASPGDLQLHSAAHHDLGLALLQQGLTDEARQAFEAGMAVAEDDDPARGDLRSALARLDLEAGHLVAARTGWVAALAQHEGAGNDLGVALALCELATIDRREGAVDEAVRRLERAIGMLTEQRAPRAAAMAWTVLGGLAQDSDRLDEARGNFERAQALHAAAGARRDLVEGLRATARLDLLLGDLEAAGTAFEAILSLCRGIGHDTLVADALEDLAEVRRRQGSDQLAAALAQQANELRS